MDDAFHACRAYIDLGFGDDKETWVLMGFSNFNIYSIL